MSDERLRIGQVTGAVGLKGAVKVLSLTDFSDRFAPGSRMHLAGEEREVEWMRSHPTKSSHARATPGEPGRIWVVKLTGIEARDRAQAMRGLYLELPLSEARELPEGAYYHHQLVGLPAAAESGRVIGQLVEVMERPANDVWVIRSGTGELLIPATREAVREVDLGRGRIVIADWVLTSDGEPPSLLAAGRGGRHAL